MNGVTYYVLDLTFIFWVTFHTLYVSYNECVPAVLLEVLKRQQGNIRSGAVRQPVRFKCLRGTEHPVAPHLTRLSSDRGHDGVQNLALK